MGFKEDFYGFYGFAEYTVNKVNISPGYRHLTSPPKCLGPKIGVW